MSAVFVPKSPCSTIDAGKSFMQAKPSAPKGHGEEKIDLVNFYHVEEEKNDLVNLYDVANSELIRTAAINKSVGVAISRSRPMRPYPSTLIPLRSTCGMQYLCEAEGGRGGIIHNLAPHMIGQGPLQCAPTSLTIALNSLSMKDNNGETLRFTKEGISQDLYRTVLPTPKHLFFSVSLKELGEQAKRYVAMSRTPTMRATTVLANHTTANEFRRKARAALVSGGAVVANFSRQTLGYTTSPFAGHCSPLVAYHEATDSFLVMDVAIKSWEPVWVPTAILFKGMDTLGQGRDAMEKQIAIMSNNKGITFAGKDRDTQEKQIIFLFKGMSDEDRKAMETAFRQHLVPATPAEILRNGRGFLLLERK